MCTHVLDKLRLTLYLAILPFGGALALENQLAQHASPYLAMHQEDPVAWQDWGEQAVALARAKDKMLFVSSGYFSCHWCHVMQRESYQNPRIAELLNQHFIPVKLDRELHPALDAYLVSYLERTQGQAGWPLNIFLTPEGYPLIGSLYLPPERFEQVLSKLQSAWAKQSGQMRNLARRALLQITANAQSAPFDPQPTGQLREQFLLDALALGDPMEGGFGEQSKFPMSPQLIGLLEMRGLEPRPALDQFLITTLDQMADLGLRDQLAGGFFRYTVDPSWHVPHFEKMLYTQAQLARVYLLAGKLYQREDYLAVARDTLDFVLQYMLTEQGLAIASYSAVDALGEEGGNYLWHPQRLVALLGEEDAALAREYWQMRGTPGFSAGFLPHAAQPSAELARHFGLTEQALAQHMANIRARLIKDRGVPPADTKQLASWNGLLIGSLAMAAQQLSEPRYAAAAEQLAQRLRSSLWQGDHLWRARSGEQSLGEADLADYAFVAEGVQRLIDVRPADGLSDWLEQLLQQAWQRFHVQNNWRLVEDSLIPGMADTLAEQDAALLSPTGVLLAVSLRSRDESLRERAVTALLASQRVLQDEPFWYPSHLAALIGLSKG